MIQDNIIVNPDGTVKRIPGTMNFSGNKIFRSDWNDGWDELLKLIPEAPAWVN